MITMQCKYSECYDVTVIVMMCCRKVTIHFRKNYDALQGSTFGNCLPGTELLETLDNVTVLLC